MGTNFKMAENVIRDSSNSGSDTHSEVILECDQSDAEKVPDHRQGLSPYMFEPEALSTGSNTKSDDSENSNELEGPR